eukprot:3349806-Rhodomonas_salina.1
MADASPKRVKIDEDCRFLAVFLCIHEAVSGTQNREHRSWDLSRWTFLARSERQDDALRKIRELHDPMIQSH